MSSSHDNDNSSDWCTIESDPGVFTELLESIGVKGVELEELCVLDDDTLAMLQPCYGLIFLFRWTPGQDTSLPNRPAPLSEVPEGLFFARQTVTNACATQALLSIVLNGNNNNNNDNSAVAAQSTDGAKEGLQLGKTLTEFKSFTSSFPPSLKGEAIGASETLQQAHNAFGRKDTAFLADGLSTARFASPDDHEVFHFIAYVPHSDGKVYELDGLQTGPICLGEYGTVQVAQPDSNKGDDAAATATDATTQVPWYSLARQAMQDRMGTTGEAISFNLMALVGDKRQNLANDPAGLAAEEAKREQWKAENERRRHNYVPLCVQLLKELARQGTLPTLVTEAQDRVAAKKQKNKA